MSYLKLKGIDMTEQSNVRRQSYAQKELPRESFVIPHTKCAVKTRRWHYADFRCLAVNESARRVTA